MVLFSICMVVPGMFVPASHLSVFIFNPCCLHSMCVPANRLLMFAVSVPKQVVSTVYII